jgi:hypothetical protein
MQRMLEEKHGIRISNKDYNLFFWGGGIDIQILPRGVERIFAVAIFGSPTPPPPPPVTQPEQQQSYLLAQVSALCVRG